MKNEKRLKSSNVFLLNFLISQRFLGGLLGTLPLKKISCPIILFHYPSMVGALLLLQSLLFVLAILHPSQILRCRLSVIADDVIGCRIVVELGHRLYMLRYVHLFKHRLHIGPIYLGYVSFSHSGRV